MSTTFLSRYGQQQMALPTFPTNTVDQGRWFKLYLAYLEFMDPSLLSLETGRLISLLAQNLAGLSRDELLNTFYTGYQNASLTRQESLRLCLEKVIQRARAAFTAYGLVVQYDKNRKRYCLSYVGHEDTSLAVSSKTVLVA